MTEKEQMLISILKCRRIDLYTRAVELTPVQQSRYDEMMRKRSEGEPLQYIIGFSDFYGCKIFLDDRVLIPRPETEILVDEVIQFIKVNPRNHLRVLDLGTGSGNISIALAKHIPHCTVTAIDLSPDALCLARDNAKFNMVDGRIHFICQDMRSYLTDLLRAKESFDIIISNPPYIETSQLDNLPQDVKREPRMALDGGMDGLDYYRLIIDKSILLLNKRGTIFFEMGDEQKGPICNLFAQQSGYKSINVYNDYMNTPRIISATIT